MAKTRRRTALQCEQRRQAGAVRGFTLIEVIVALGLLSMVALALTETLLGTQRALFLAEHQMEATVLAADALERARAAPGSDSDRHGRFERRWTAAPADEALGLWQIDVVVEWSDPSPRKLTLRTVVLR